MKIAADLLQEMRAVRDARRANETLNSGIVDTSRLAERKKAVWARIRSQYNLPQDVRFSIELDGEAAGEIRVKGTGQAWVPPAGHTTCGTTCASGSTRHIAVDSDGEEHIFDSFADFKDWLLDEYSVRVIAG